MTRTHITRELLNQVTPAQLIAYLDGHAWEEVRRTEAMRGYCHAAAGAWRVTIGARISEGRHRVDVPLHPTFADYAARVNDVLVVVAEVERGTTAEVLRDVAPMLFGEVQP